jgi:hypothetical protein
VEIAKLCRSAFIAVVTLIAMDLLFPRNDFRLHAQVSIPNPDDLISVSALLRNKSVVDALSLSESELGDIQTIRDGNSGSTSSVKIEINPGGPKLGNDEIKRRLAERRIELDSKLRGILDPTKQERLRQIGFQVEIERIGLGGALSNGYLGKSIGVLEHQKPSLREAANNVETQLKEQLENVRLRVLDKILSKLSTDQQDKAKAAMGVSFLFRENTATWRHEHWINIRPGRKHAIPDPAALICLVGLASNSSVANAIDMHAAEIATLAEMHANAKGPIALVGYRFGDEREAIEKSIVQKLESMYNEKQRERLKQIAFQVEVYRLGIVDSLTVGYLGREIVVTELQAMQLRSDSAELVQKATEEASKEIQLAREQVFLNLDPKQRSKAMSLLGQVFLFRE